MNKQKIGNLAEIRSGYSFRSALEEVSDGVPVLQIRDLEESGKVDPSQVVQVADEGFKDSHRVKSGEVLFAARGSQQRAGVFEGNPEGAVAGSQFLVVQVKDQGKVLPEYLAWYLNRSEVKKKLEAMASGATIPHVSIAMLKCLDVEVPTLQVQKQLLEMQASATRELQLLQALMVETQLRNQALMKEFLRTHVESEANECI
jgi:restriction endonuclease S subunit